MRNLESIRLIVLDVDGTMTDGGIYIDNNCLLYTSDAADD